ncbi:hypothetical protein PCE1_003610 [Barthelona sp. PCE]
MTSLTHLQKTEKVNSGSQGHNVYLGTEENESQISITLTRLSDFPLVGFTTTESDSDIVTIYNNDIKDMHNLAGSEFLATMGSWRSRCTGHFVERVKIAETVVGRVNTKSAKKKKRKPKKSPMSMHGGTTNSARTAEKRKNLITHRSDISKTEPEIKKQKLDVADPLAFTDDVLPSNAPPTSVSTKKQIVFDDSDDDDDFAFLKDVKKEEIVKEVKQEHSVMAMLPVIEKPKKHDKNIVYKDGKRWLKTMKEAIDKDGFFRSEEELQLHPDQTNIPVPKKAAQKPVVKKQRTSNA